MGGGGNASAYGGPAEYRRSQGPFPPLKDVREGLDVRWYRCSLPRGRLGELAQRSDRRGLFQAGGHLALWLTTGSLVYAAWARSCGAAAVCAALFLHGTVGSTMVYGCHELGHGTVFRTRWVNQAFLYLYSLLFWWDPFDYAASHTYHHRYSQFPEADRENLPPMEPSLSPWLLLEMFTVSLTGKPGRVFGKGGLISTVRLTVKAALGGIASDETAQSHEWLQAVHADQPGEAVKSMWFSRAIVAFHSAVLLGAAASRLWILVPILSLHCFFANWYSYFVGTTQHLGLKNSTPDFRMNTRSVVMPDPVSEFLFWHMNWHCEHHMFAAVPCYNLAAVHREVRHDMPQPRTLVGAWREMRAIWKKHLEDPSYEFETPLPPTAHPPGGTTVDLTKAGAGVAPEDDADSIGDLAPSGLRVKKTA